jgi:23S rRNA (uridine2552-2'-O)-methyltransferase
MSKRWFDEHKREHYYRKAKAEGYRSRAAYKLLHINEKFTVIKKGMVVLDLGAAPGGWSQAALSLIGDSGKVVGVDIDTVAPNPPAIFIQGDITDPETQEEIRSHIPDCDTVVSDMSPDISGVYSIDQARSVFLATTAFEVAKKFLRRGGSFVCKVFEGEDFKEFHDMLKGYFQMVKNYSPPSSRKTSSEIYVVCKGFGR